MASSKIVGLMHVKRWKKGIEPIFTDKISIKLKNGKEVDKFGRGDKNAFSAHRQYMI